MVEKTDEVEKLKKKTKSQEQTKMCEKLTQKYRKRANVMSKNSMDITKDFKKKYA